MDKKNLELFRRILPVMEDAADLLPDNGIGKIIDDLAQEVENHLLALGFDPTGLDDDDDDDDDDD